MNNCIFCKIIKKEIPNYTVYESDTVLSFLDIYPHAKGHTVVIPKNHIEKVVDIPDNMLRDIMFGVRKSVKKINDVLCPSGYNIGWNDGRAGGQVVPHTHIHIMPRWENDGGGSMHSIINNPGDVSVDELAKLFT